MSSGRRCRLEANTAGGISQRYWQLEMTSHFFHLRNAFISFAAGCIPAWDNIDFVLTPDGAFPTIRTALQRSDDLLRFLHRSGIEATTIQHTLWPVGTRPSLGILPDHWLLQNDSGRLFLIMVPPGTTLDVNQLAVSMGLGGERLSVAPERLLRGIFGIDRGSLSVLSVISDTACRVTVAIDCSLMKEDALRLHALTQRRAVILCPGQLANFLQLTKHPPSYVSGSVR